MIIDAGRGRIIVDAHKDGGYVSTQFDGAGAALFLDDKQLMAVAGEMIAIARKIRRGK